MSGTIDMNNNVISNLQTPTLDLDATNKGYVDTLIELVSGGSVSSTTSIQEELDLTQSSAGLSGTGSYTTTGTYISNSISIVDATVKLDSQVATNTLAIKKTSRLRALHHRPLH